MNLSLTHDIWCLQRWDRRWDAAIGYRPANPETDYARTAETAPARHSDSGEPLTDQSLLCYNSFTEQGQLLWVGVCLWHSFGYRFSVVSMVSINLGIRFYEVETDDAGESIEPEESH
jgi:hypothetical protein